jgi:hypothetical protein
VYHYSGTRGSRYDINDLEYVPTGYYYATSGFAGGNIPEAIATNNIDSSYFFNIDFDTAREWLWYNSTPSYYLDHVETFTHAAGGQRIDDTYEGYDHSGSRNQYYHAIQTSNSGLLTSIIKLYNNRSGGWDTVYVRHLIYDASGRLLIDSVSDNAMGNWSFRRHYSYGGGAGYLLMTEEVGPNSSQGIATINRTSKTYYPDGRVKKSILETITSVTRRLFPSVIDSFGYNAGVQGHTYHSTTGLDTDGSFSYRRIWLASRVNGSGQKDSITSYYGVFGSAVNPPLEYTFSVQYNSAGYPLKRNFYDPYKVGGTLVGYEVYDYEPAIGVQVGAAPGKSAISLSPNPTTGALTINFGSIVPKERIVISIFNAAGQLVHSESFVPQSNSSTIFLCNTAAPGIYSISVCGTHNAVLYRGTFIKQ